MGNALVAVPASDEEHGRTVGDGSDNSASGNSCAGGVDLTAGTSIASNSAAITSTSSRRCSGVTGSSIRACSRERTASCEWTSGVDQAGKVIDGSVLVVPERISGIAELSCKLGLQVFRNSEHCHGRNEALVLGGVEGLQSIVLDVGDRDVETICDSVGQVVEDLVTGILGRHEWVVQRPLEADLAHEAVLRDVARNTTRGSNHLGKARGNTTAGSNSGRSNCGWLLDNAGRHEDGGLGVGGRRRNSTHRCLRTSGCRDGRDRNRGRVTCGRGGPSR